MKQNLKKLLPVFLALFLLIEMLSGCQADTPVESTLVEESLPVTENPFVDNPFEQTDGANTDFLGWLSHGPENPVLDENGLRVAYEYIGGEFELEYHVTATGTAKNVGFLLFLDGIPQPYRINGEDGTDYMHTFSLEEDDKEYQFSFLFTPVTGSAGETLRLSIFSVNNAQFKPDMVTSTSYGFYHDILQSSIDMRFEANPDIGTDNVPISALTSVDVMTETMTSDFINTYLENGFMTNGQSMVDRLDDTVYEFISYGGETVYNNINVTDLDTVHVTYQMVGTPGATYRVSFFANHKPLTSGETMTWDMTLSKGKVAVLEADIDVSALEDFTTFYVFACPVDAESSSTATTLIGIKTGSVLLYREAL